MSRTRGIDSLARTAKEVQQQSASFSEMYSDRIGSNGAGNRKRSVKDRLGESLESLDNTSRQDFSKRFRGYDEKWKHDMYDEADKNSIAKGGQISTQDLRSKLKKSLPRGTQGGNDASGGIKDLREKLSGPAPPAQIRAQTVSTSQQRSSSAVKVATPGVTTVSGSKPADKPSSVQKTSTKTEVMTVPSFLQSLGLNKYLITFQAEEIDISVLRLMKDEDLKELGIPMGPRKKIMLALAAQSKQ